MHPPLISEEEERAFRRAAGLWLKPLKPAA
jgi:hypothetical protein